MTDDDRPPTARRRRVTAEDVARLSGVSRATVSYVLNNVYGQTIPTATRERVRAAATELAYVPVAAAASLRRGHSRIVLVVTEPALSGFITEPFLAAIAARLTTDGLVPVTHQYSTDDALYALIAEIRPFGLIALAPLSASVAADIEAAGVPRIYQSAQGDPTYPRPWEEEIGTIQARHLIDRGARRLAYASPTSKNPRTVMARFREIGAAAACKAALLPSPVHLELDTDLAAAAEIMRQVLPGRNPIGICAFDDEVAAVALAAAQFLGYTVGKDFRVIGVDDAPFAAFLAPPLTTISINGREMGHALAERFLNGPNSEASSSVPHALAAVVERATA